MGLALIMGMGDTFTIIRSKKDTCNYIYTPAYFEHNILSNCVGVK